MKDKIIVIAGGSGFVGMQMAARWARENEVIVLTRGIADSINNAYRSNAGIPSCEAIEGIERVVWDGKRPGSWTKSLEGAHILINLAGRSVNCRYNARNKAEIMHSRLDATRALGDAVLQLKNPPELWINGASTTIYRHAPDRPQDEYTGEMENDFSVQVCKAWEAAFNEINLPATRKIVMRMAIVLGKGGVLTPYSWLARLGLGGKHGNGQQIFSWIHVDDLCRIVEWLHEKRSFTGTLNAAAPDPVANFKFMSLLRQIYRMPVGIPAPAWLLEIAAFFHRTETELLLKSRWVLPTRLLNENFTFDYFKIEDALNNLLKKP